LLLTHRSRLADRPAAEPQTSIAQDWPMPSTDNVRPSPRNTATGDLARQDSGGYVYPSRRLKDTINRGGGKFGPTEVEQALRTHPAVRDVAVAGIADEDTGQRVGVTAVVRSPVTIEELREHCRASIAYFKLPERPIIVGEIPYNDTGKINRRRLASLIAGET
jgi:acyl-CoA synthetase (AMP-forming)/AMP-acid ligase II